MSAALRRGTLEQEIIRRGSLSVADAAALLDVSEMTVRRDFDALERTGRILRVRGGAVARVSRSYEPPLQARASRSHVAKRAIAEKAAAIIEDGETIILDVGSTTIELARALRGKRGLTVVTASLPIAEELSDQPDMRVVLTGGIVRPGERSVVGVLAEGAFSALNCDTVFLGVAGIDLEKGLTEFSMEDARVKQAAIRSARQVVVLDDEAKLGAVAFAHIAPLNVADLLISDAGPHHAVIRGVTQAGVRYIHAPNDGGMR